MRGDMSNREYVAAGPVSKGALAALGSDGRVSVSRSNTLLISRGAALALLQSQGHAHTDRARNYEIEGALCGLPGAFGGEWIVDEPCPFNGTFCRYGQIHPERHQEELDAIRVRRGW